MKFDYVGSVSLSADTGDPIAVFRPIIPVIVHGPHGAREYDALVDTGADTCVFPERVADELGFTLHETVGPNVTAYGGQVLPTTFSEVQIEISDGHESLRWLMQAFFHRTKEDTLPPLILGLSGFLEYFTATFIGSEFAIDLKPNEFLPRLAEGDSSPHDTTDVPPMTFAPSPSSGRTAVRLRGAC